MLFAQNINMQGCLINSLANGVSAQDATTLSQVNALIAAATIDGPSKGVVAAATTAALPANTYANGTLGVGATLTGNSNGAFPTIDGVAAALNNLYLVKNEVTAANNGIYQLTTVGDAGTEYVLTRATNFDTVATMETGSYAVVVAGTVNANTFWYLSSTVSTVGTSAVTFNALATVTDGTATSVSGNSVSVLYDNTTIGVNGSNQLYVISSPDSISTSQNFVTGDWSSNAITFSSGTIGLGTGPLSVYVMDNSGNQINLQVSQSSGAVTITKSASVSTFAGTVVFVAA